MQKTWKVSNYSLKCTKCSFGPLSIYCILFCFLASLRGVENSCLTLSCNCQAFSTCSWSSKLVDQLTLLPKNHQYFQPLFSQFKNQICDGEKRHVWCCQDETPALENCLESLKNTPPSTTSTTTPKPIAKKPVETISEVYNEMIIFSCNDTFSACNACNIIYYYIVILYSKMARLWQLIWIELFLLIDFT